MSVASMIEMRRRCVHCPAELHAVPVAEQAQGRLDDWYYVDDQGRSAVDNRPQTLIDDPKQWWADLAAKDIGAYSALKCRLDPCQWSWWHNHVPGPAIAQPTSINVPFCHAQPMYLGVAGWYCRTTRVLLCDGISR